ncbi:hypothetical protein ABZX34_32715 [Streptomyces sp. NPDC004362]|uniref:hypothetical protein n=1 Tax=Streptomyces sp. NPDC004362 TaxID=3154456 RepID=UPI0033A8DCA3
MIVSVVSMPAGTITRTHVAEARELPAASRFLLVDIELPEEAVPGEQPLAPQLGLEPRDLAWLGRKSETVRAENLGDRAGFVVPLSSRKGSCRVIALYVLHRTRLWRRLRENGPDDP